MARSVKEKMGMLGFFMICALIPVLSFFSKVNAYDILARWKPSPEPEVIGYVVHWGTKSRSYTHHKTVEGRMITSCLLTDLEDKEVYYAAVTAFDAKGNFSDYSNEAISAKGSEIVFYSDSQEVHFSENPDGSVRGLVPVSQDEKVFPEEIKEIYACSDRVGWPTKIQGKLILPSASGVFNVENNYARISGTANNEKPIFWFVSLTNGGSRWLSPDFFMFGYDPVSMPYDIFTIIKSSDASPRKGIEYGSYVNPAIIINVSAIVINFGSNVIGNLVSENGPVFGVEPNDIVRIKWNSYRMGQGITKSISGTIAWNNLGNLVGIIRPVPMLAEDQGLPSVELVDGRELWFPIEKFQLSPNAQISNGVIKFSITQ